MNACRSARRGRRNPRSTPGPSSSTPERLRFGGDVGNPHHLPRLETFVGDRLVGDDDEVSESPVLVLGELGDLHADRGERRVRADVGREIEPADLWIQEILACRLLWAVQELLPIDNLDDTVLVLKRSFASSWLHFQCEVARAAGAYSYWLVA